MSLQRIILNTPLGADGFKSVCDLSVGQLPALQNLTNYLQSMPDQQTGLLSINVAAVQAAGTVTFASTGPTNTQTCTICGVTFTCVTSGATGNQFNRSDTPATVAANLASAINAASSMAGIITATSALGVVTLTAVVPGKIGNGLVMANVSLSNTTISSFASGTDGTAYSLDLR